MVVHSKNTVKWISMIIVVLWCISVYVWMYNSTKCIQQIEELSQLHEMDSELKYQNNKLQRQINSLEKMNVHLQTVINNQTEQHQNYISESNQRTHQPSTLSLASLLQKLKTIGVKKQIERINQMYKSQMGWNHSLNISDITSNKKGANKALILTAFVINPGESNEKYDIKTQQSAYDSKLVYADVHRNETLLIIDTFDYISHLSIPINVVARTLTNYEYDDWNNVLSPFFHETRDRYPDDFAGIDRNYNRTKHDRFDCKKLLNKYWWKRKIHINRARKEYHFGYSYKITNHFNKILSILYWTRYFNYILWMDDDALFGNLNLSIDYYFNLVPKQDTFLILPLDHNNAMVFSNFAFYINATKTPNDRATNFLYEWFKSRNYGFQFYDQDAMNYAILQYLITYDYKFKRYMNEHYLFMNPFKYLLFYKCIEYCKVCPVDHVCMDTCLRAIYVRRCFEKNVLQNQNKCTSIMNTTIFWTPLIATKLSNDYNDYDIYPFVFQNSYGAHYTFLSNQSYRDPELKYLRKIYDNTFIIHKRVYMEAGKLGESVPFLYAYAKSNSRRFVVDYLREHTLLLNESSYPDIDLQTRFTLDRLLSKYKRARTTISRYSK
eukprot:9110_1